MSYTTRITKAGTLEVLTNNYKIGGTLIPSPTSIECEYHIRTRSFNDGDDITHTKPIRMKRVVIWHYKNVSNETFTKIHDIVLKDNLITNGKMTFNITTQFIGYDTAIQMKMYLGSPITAQSVYGEENKMLVNFDVRFIEPEGIALKPVQQ